jgi:DNA-binding response OmpR family regulator
MAVNAGERIAFLDPMDFGSTRMGMEAGPHVLVVDDDPQLREMVATALRRVGYSVVTATDGERGWDAMWSAPVDLVITDYSMPNLNGLELLKRMSSSGLMIPAILMSARFPRDISEVLETLSHGGALHKPFRLEELYFKVGSILDDIRPAYLPSPASIDTGRYKGRAERHAVRKEIGLRRLRLASKILVHERTALLREGGNSALERVCTKMEEHFLARAGMVGFQLLLAHALVLARREVAWLGPIKISNDGVFRELDQAGAKFGAAEVFQGEVAVITELLTLLTSLLGEPMTHARLHEVWRESL